MIVFRGRGILIAGVTFGCLLATEFATRAHFHDDRYYQEHGWPKLVGFFAAAALAASLSGFRIGAISEINPSRPKTSIFRKDDELFFVPARYWPAILCALGIGFYFVRE